MNNELYLTKDSLATLLICSNLAISTGEELKPYTTIQWNKLADKLLNSSMKRPSMFFETKEEDWKRELNLNSEEVERLNKLISRSGQLGIELENLNSLGIKITTRSEANYPKRLKDILRKGRPPVIFYCGDMSIAETEGVSIIGSRNVDENGLTFTKKISEKCVSEGFHIISGGAKGVDIIAQDAALQSGGKVISFIADSLIQNIKKKEVRQNVTNGKLLLMSAINPKSGFKVYTAMDRNKYVYCLSSYAIVVSSDYNKGGTWAGATENLKNNWVPLFVRNEEGIPKGNEELLNRGIKSIDTFLVEDKSISIKKWFKENSNLLQSQNIEQIGINTLLNNKQEEKENINKENINIVREDHIDERTDLYDVVWTSIEKVMTEPKSLSELCEIFNINRSQMTNWITRATNEKRIKKLTNPARFVVIEYRG